MRMMVVIERQSHQQTCRISRDKFQFTHAAVTPPPITPPKQHSVISSASAIIGGHVYLQRPSLLACPYFSG
jgi:hypothetical protein